MNNGTGSGWPAAASPGDGPGKDLAGAASIARIYDYWLGGKDNYAADRAAGKRLLEIYPGAAALARDNRAFLTRAVRYVAGQGVQQFIDVGSGLPTSPNVHEVARSAVQGARVVYVDRDPVVLAYAEALLADAASGVVVVAGDMIAPELILAHPRLCGLIDFTEPVCVLLVSVLHFVSADKARVIINAFTERMAAGSYLVISVGTSSDPELAARFTSAYSAGALISHPPDEVRSWLSEFELAEPGLVDAAAWRPPGPRRRLRRSAPAAVLAGVGRKPGGPA